MQSYDRGNGQPVNPSGWRIDTNAVDVRAEMLGERGLDLPSSGHLKISLYWLVPRDEAPSPRDLGKLDRALQGFEAQALKDVLLEAMRRELELLKKGQRPEGSPVPPAEIREFFRLPHVWTSIKIPFQGTCAERLASWIKALEKVDAGKIKPLVQSWTRSGVPEMN